MTELLITSSVLILAILLIRALFQGRMSRRLQYGLWLLAALRLLLPFSIPAPSSVMNRVDTAPIRRTLAGQVVYIGPELPGPGEGREDEPAALPEQGGAEAGVRPPLPAVLWGAGMALMGLGLLGVNLSFYLRLKKQRKAWPVPGCRLPVYLAEGIPSPCLFGLLRPAIYITPAAAADRRALGHVLAHEYCHYRQWDHIWSLVRCVCLTVYWFDPLVWAAAVCSRADCELSCDELAVKRLGSGERAAYGQTLVALVSQRGRLSHVACTATTMAAGRGIRRRISMIVSSPKTSLSVLAVILLSAALLVSCTFTGKTLSPAQAADLLWQSISCQDNSITFTIPQDYADGEDWNILVQGRAAGEPGETAGVQLFEEENRQRSWQPGQTYTIDLAGVRYLELTMEISLHSDPGTAQAVDLLGLTGGTPAESAEGYYTVQVTFPAYQNGRTQENGLIFDTPPFDARLSLPQGWSVYYPAPEERTGGPLWTPMEIWDGEGLVATLGFNRYEPYEGDDVPEEEFYKTIYYELRLGRMEQWDPYTPVRTDGNGGSGLAAVQCMDTDFMAENPDAPWAGVPTLETTGILCHNSDLQVYAALRFNPKRPSPADEETRRTIAESLVLVPSEYGLGGKRYGGSYGDRDYSGIAVQDAQGNDVSKILIDLWYCASDAYDVDGVTLFQNGEWVSLLEGHPDFVELTDYSQVMPRVFTQRAIAQYEDSHVVLIQKLEDGRVYRLGPWGTGYSYAGAMTDIRAVQVEEDRIVAEVTYERRTGYIGEIEDPASYVPVYGTVPFTVVRQNGVWLVDEYVYPGN